MAQVRWQTQDDGSLHIIDEIHKVIVHRFSTGDVEDPDIYAAQPLWDWQEGEAGKFVMEHAIEPPTWQRQTDPYNYGYQYVIVAELEKKKLAEFYLKWGNPNGNSTLW